MRIADNIEQSKKLKQNYSNCIKRFKKKGIGTIMNKDIMKKRRGCNFKKEPIRTSRN